MHAIPMTNVDSIFASPTLLLMEKIQERNEKNQPNFLIPTKFISEEAAQIGFLLNALLNSRRKGSELYRTFFCNSAMEALHGTLKIIRHNNYKKGKNGAVLIYDPLTKDKLYFNPLNVVSEKALIPGIVFEDQLEKIDHRLKDKQNPISGFIYYGHNASEWGAVSKLFSFCKEHDILTAFNESQIQSWYQCASTFKFDCPPDIYVFGENLTQYEVPFGCFSMSQAVFRPWNNMNNCLLHSSTYSGNLLALSILKDLFLCNYKQLKLIDLTNRKNVVKAFANYVNPYAAFIYDVLNLSPSIQQANGSILRINSESFYDCVGGSGCGLRGHNQKDIVPSVIKKHDHHFDYWKELSSLLSKMTGLSHAFPAVSGASAVEIAIIMAMLGAKNKRKILTFKDNYSGKTLISLSVTEYEGYRMPFNPIYHDVIIIDPFEKNAKAQLTKELNSGEIGLVWFEILQGDTLKTIPEELIQIIKEERAKNEFFIGVDEILTGIFRTGSFLICQKLDLMPDLITLSKGLSDLTIPIGLTLIAEKVYQQAILKNAELVTILQSKYVNQVSAHIALNALKAAIMTDTEQRVKRNGEFLRNSLDNLKNRSAFIKEIRGDGLLLYLKLNENAFPISLIGEDFFAFIFSSYLMKKAKIFSFCCRLTPPLGISDQEIDEICQKLHSCLDKVSGAKLLFVTLSAMIRIYSKSLFYKLCGYRRFLRKN